MSERATKATIRYKVYDIERGLLVEPEDTGGHNLFSDYETMQEASDAMKKRVWHEGVILPVVYIRPDWESES